jgi:uncharacterized protein (DUF1015 family)
VAGDLSALICPPYDVISPEQRERLLARSPYNAVRVELPAVPGSGASVEPPGQPDDDYATAAATLRAWRDHGVLRVDETPALYVYEEAFRLAGDAERVQRGFFARLRLEPLGLGVRPHERTMSGPKEDRLRLLRAAATQTSSIVVLPGVRDGRLGEVLGGVAAREPDAEATDDAGVRHRLWVVPGGSAAAAGLVDTVGTGPLTIADGHHRYETALRYRDERRASDASARRGSGDAPVDHVMALVLDPGRGTDRPTILPTHRVLHGAAVLGRVVLAAAREYLRVTARDPDGLIRSFFPPFSGAIGRAGLIVGAAGFEVDLTAPGAANLAGGDAPAVVRVLDVAVVEGLLRVVRDTVGHGEPWLVTYTHDAVDAARAVTTGDAAAALLVAPTPLSAILDVAASGAVMPEKSTYFYPKVATGLVMNPLE